MDFSKIKTIVEAALMAAGRPLSVDELQSVFGDFSRPERKQIREALTTLQADYEERAIELKEVASGFRIQVRTRNTEYISRLWEERPPRYSRALMETLALIAYRQPITRGEIEEIRGVSVSTSIVRTLMERNWVRVIGHRDVPGRPAMFGTTKEFLDYFGLKKLDDLPSLRELQEIEDLSVQLELPTGEEGEPLAAMPGEAGDQIQSDDAQAGKQQDPDSAQPQVEAAAGTGEHSEQPVSESAPPRMHLVRSESNNDNEEVAAAADDQPETADALTHS